MKSMDPSKPPSSSRVQELFYAAADLSHQEQVALLARECSGDPVLEASVLRLLRADNLTEPIPAGAALEIEARHTAQQLLADYNSRSFGAYRTTECIGSGGMSVVYKAVRDDDEYRKTVAVKILPGGFETQDRVERFRRERQILANLDHPNIARLLDGGTSLDGSPYLVMEYVDGLPVDGYVEQAKLSIEQRLHLFKRVCNAVQYAHANLVVHCDLKPSNILVTAGGSPKLLDFGIAKLLDEERRTRTATAPWMTPDFASPEQVLAQPITTGSDVYSLGVLLYVILSGLTPYSIPARTPQELSRAVCERDLDFASCRGVPADLRKIITMATRKEAQRRYQSVERFQEDIDLYLARRPVIARRGSFAYRAGKHLRRNALALAVVFICTSAIVYGFASRWTESRRAERRFNELRGLAHFLMFDTYDGLAKLPGSTSLRKAVVGEAQRYLDSLGREASNEPALRQELADSYLRLGGVQGAAFSANLGDTRGALLSYRKAQAILEDLSSKNASPSARGILWGTYKDTGNLLLREGRVDEAVETLNRGVELAATMYRAEPNNPTSRLRLARSHIGAGHAVLRGAKTRVDCERALQLFEQGYRELTSPPVPQDNAQWARNTSAVNFYLSYAEWRLAEITGDIGYLQQALAYQQRGEEITRLLAQRDPENQQQSRNLGDNLNDIGYTLTKLGRYREALAQLRLSLSIFKALASADSSNVEAQSDLSNVCRNLGAALVKSGRKAEARQYARRSLSISEAISRLDPMNEEIKKAGMESAALLEETRVRQ
jgi:eukaryotic-like serine/threonine-protein kinase